MPTLNPLFTSHMVLQANRPVRIFGSGCGNISIALAGQSKTIYSAEDSWILELEPHDYGGPFCMTVSLDGVQTVLDDIYFGDVYLLGGQSNMQFELQQTNEPVENYKGNENVRFFTIDRPEGGQLRTQDGWIPCSKENAGLFSAIGYYVGTELATETGHAIGLISCCQGASVIQTWMPQHLFDDNRFYVSDADKFEDHFDYPWNKYGYLYNTMLSVAIPFVLKAVVWYQGEANSSPAEGAMYLDLLKAFIENIRNVFFDPTLPFVIVQLPEYIPWDGPGWRGIQTAQMQAQDTIPFVHTVVSRDVCENDDLHPKSKKQLSLRIANILAKQ